MTNKTMPKHIFLQIHAGFDGETTWCEDNHFEDDVEYVRADLVENNAIGDVIKERVKQACKGYDAAHDDADAKGAHAQAGAYYATAAHYQRKWYGVEDTPFTEIEELSDYAEESSIGYPWSSETKSVEYSPRANLVKAAALLIAEIERIDREESSND